MKSKLKLAGRAFLAAITSPQAVKLEEGLGVLVAVRVLQALGASAGLIYMVQHLVG